MPNPDNIEINITISEQTFSAKSEISATSNFIQTFEDLMQHCRSTVFAAIIDYLRLDAAPKRKSGSKRPYKRKTPKAESTPVAEEAEEIHVRITAERRERLRDLKREGMTSAEAADEAGLPLPAVNKIWASL